MPPQPTAFRDRVKRAFIEVCDLDRRARGARLKSLCGADARLRRQVELLLAHDCEDSIIEGAREEPERRVGRTIRRYKLLECAGSGGMGVVYRAEDVRLKRTVAVKFLAERLLGDERLRQRFRREAQAAALIDHPAVCAVYDMGTAAGAPFIVTAWVEGDSLDRAIAAGRLAPARAIECAIQICGGLQAAHAAGVVHRDLKPSNVLLARGPRDRTQAKIIDFGLARICGRSGLTDAGQLLGTAGYVCPEILKGRPVDHRADIWSLGVMLYEMLSGARPFDAENRERIFYMICNESPPRLAGETGRIIARAIERDPARRYQDAGSLLADLCGAGCQTCGGLVTRPAPVNNRRAG